MSFFENIFYRVLTGFRKGFSSSGWNLRFYRVFTRIFRGLVIFNFSISTGFGFRSYKISHFEKHDSSKKIEFLVLEPF